MRLFGLEIKRSTSNNSPAAGEAKMAGVMLMPWERTASEVFQPNDYQAQILAFRSWVYVCASKNAAAVAASPLRLYAAKPNKTSKLLVKTKAIDRVTEMRLSTISGLQHFVRKAAELVEVIEHPFLDMLSVVNPLTNRFDLWELTEIYLEMTGNAYWYIAKNKLGTPDSIWILPAQNVKIVPGQSGNIITGYVYTSGLLKVPFDVEEVVHFKFPSPTSPLYGMSPLVAVSGAYSYDLNARRFEDTLMKNNARPEAVLETENVLSAKEFERIKEQWNQTYSGVNRVGKTIILEKGLTYRPITMSAKDMQYLMGRKYAREEIAAAFGVPLSKLTTESVNLANARMGEWQYKKDTIEPRLRRIEEKLNEKLMPMYDDKIFVAYDTPVPEDEQFELEERRSNLTTYVTTINEERAKLGLSPVDWGDVPLVPPGLAPLGSQPAGMGGIPGMDGGGMPSFPGAPGRPQEKPQEPEPKKPEGSREPPVEAKPKMTVDDFVNKLVHAIKNTNLAKEVNHHG